MISSIPMVMDSSQAIIQHAGNIGGVIDSGRLAQKINWYLLFSGQHTSLRSKRTDWLARNQDNVYEWNDMSISGLLFQLSSTIKIQTGHQQGKMC